MAQLASVAYRYVLKEPVVPEQGEGDQEGLVCNLAGCKAWNPETEALFDFCVVNPGTQSYKSSSILAILESAVKAKKAKRRKACTDRQADFTLFICSADGVICEAVK